MSGACLTLAHGSGGLAMERLIRDLFLKTFADPELARLEDAARLESGTGRIALTTDAFVVDPPFFPGGDIGRLAVCGTVNDLAVAGAVPECLSTAFILEEGLALAELRRIVESIKRAADEAGVRIVTGDTKVVPRRAADGVFITTSGVGRIPAGIALGAERLRPGDRILVSGPVGDHGAAVLDARGELGLSHGIVSDCRPLTDLVRSLLAAVPVHALRDPTRGGLAAVVNEWSRACGFGIAVEETAVPVREAVRGLCELLGFDPLYLACEGRLVAAVPAEAAATALEVLRGHADGREAALVGEVVEPPAQVVLHTAFGGQRLLDQPEGDLLPRIC
ncbi:hydrogenase expression/formation protein HypE [Methylomarinovum tepidoasis]|uniref:Hydrogenase expression/formation protein HypE n=1 Tax=Methylomarinovum tepidoasis TaxID=2840183 RepID=A0AAU9C8P7_9GAMM|nr:hydrogenase expression/formation protein HypE [Methylomarinovum sp. IN45]BCX89659.1 hydrogenase expression/formation protein HypE [Methylomarinovum sp. IN45]